VKPVYKIFQLWPVVMLVVSTTFTGVPSVFDVNNEAFVQNSISAQSNSVSDTYTNSFTRQLQSIIPVPSGAPSPNVEENIDHWGKIISSELILKKLKSKSIFEVNASHFGLTVSDIIFPFHYFW
jgi:hypothetical protein